MNILIISNQLSNRNRLSNPVIDNLIRVFNKSDVNITRLPVETNEYGVFAYLILFFNLFMIKIITPKKYKVVHVHFGGFQAFITSIFFKQNLVVSFHGSDLHGGSPRTKISRWKSRLNVLASLLSVKYSNRCTVVSNSLIDYIPVNLRHKIETISTGVDYNVFTPMDKTLCKSQLNLSKDFNYILFSDISNSSIKRRDIAEGVVNILSNLGCNYKLLIMSKVAYEDVPIYINSSDFVLIVSDNEGSPNIVKEALSCEKPIFSVNVGDVSDYVLKEDSCLLLTSQNPQIIAKEILSKSKLTSKPILRSKWHDIINIESISESYLKIYNSVNIK